MKNDGYYYNYLYNDRDVDPWVFFCDLLFQIEKDKVCIN